MQNFIKGLWKEQLILISVFDQYLSICFRFASLLKVRQNDVKEILKFFLWSIPFDFSSCLSYATTSNIFWANNTKQLNETIDWNWNRLTQFTSFLVKTVKCETILYSGRSLEKKSTFLWMGHRKCEGLPCNFIGSTCYLLPTQKYTFFWETNSLFSVTTTDKVCKASKFLISSFLFLIISSAGSDMDQDRGALAWEEMKWNVKSEMQRSFIHVQSESQVGWPFLHKMEGMQWKVELKWQWLF